MKNKNVVLAAKLLALANDMLAATDGLYNDGLYNDGSVYYKRNYLDLMTRRFLGRMDHRVPPQYTNPGDDVTEDDIQNAIEGIEKVCLTYLEDLKKIKS